MARPLRFIRTKNLFYSRIARTTHIWKRMHKHNRRNGITYYEPEKAYNAFLFYLHSIPANRTQLNVSISLNIPAGTVRTWAWRWSWKMRAFAHDRWVERQRTSGQVKDKKQRARELINLHRRIARIGED